LNYSRKGKINSIENHKGRG